MEGINHLQRYKNKLKNKGGGNKKEKKTLKKEKKWKK